MQRLCCISGFYWSYVFLVVLLELVFLFQDSGCSCAGRAVAVFGAFRLDLSGMCRNIFCFVCPENLSSGFGLCKTDQSVNGHNIFFQFGNVFFCFLCLRFGAHRIQPGVAASLVSLLHVGESISSRVFSTTKSNTSFFIMGTSSVVRF